jgi:hypothetical protein
VIVSPFNITFNIRDRYSGILEWQESVKNTSEIKSGIPKFPEKKIFGAREEAFIMKRAKELEIFLNMFLKHPQVL